MPMKRLLATFLLAVPVFASAATQTIVFLRHGEKPERGLGQITCQGLNRALALPKVLLGRYGKPAAIFASNPGIEKEDRGQHYFYVRPLATIEPTAVRLGMPINARYGFEDIAGLREALLDPIYQDATVFVAWEHRLAEKLARELVGDFGGDAKAVPYWGSPDFDSLYVVTLSGEGKARKAGFRVDKQGLDGLPASCPGPN